MDITQCKISYLNDDGQPIEEILDLKGLCLGILSVEMPVKIIFHTFMLIAPLFIGMWMYLSQFVFFSPYVIYKAVKHGRMYRHNAYVYRNWIDFWFEVAAPVYRHYIIMESGGYKAWYNQ